jgi:membrane protease YdiL (CAAX protease family)
MFKNRYGSAVIGFVLLFILYHFPEFFTAFWIMAVGKIGFLVLAFIIARWQSGKGWSVYGLGVNTHWPAQLLKGFITGIIFYSLSQLVAFKAGYTSLTNLPSLRHLLSQLPFLLFITAIPSLAEDILTRGYLWAHLKFMKPVLWILLSAFVFVLNHIWRLQSGPAVLSYLFLLGLVLAMAVQLTKTLWLAFGIHWGANLAFETSHTVFQIQSTVTHNGSTWLLAGAWLLLALFLSVVYFKKNQKALKL